MEIMVPDFKPSKNAKNSVGSPVLKAELVF